MRPVIANILTVAAGVSFAAGFFELARTVGVGASWAVLLVMGLAALGVLLTAERRA